MKKNTYKSVGIFIIVAVHSISWNIAEGYYRRPLAAESLTLRLAYWNVLDLPIEKNKTKGQDD